MTEPSLWRVKRTWITWLTLGISIPYYALQHLLLFPITIMPATFVDDAVPFSPALVWPYMSLYPLLLIPPWLIRDPAEVKRFVIGFALFGSLSLVIFFFFPTGVVRTHLDGPSNWLYDLLLRIDTPVHACPSLHASMAVYSALWSAHLLRGQRGALLGLIGITLWTLAILYATIATRQHVLIDLLAGAALACAAYLAMARRRAAD